MICHPDRVSSNYSVKLLRVLPNYSPINSQIKSLFDYQYKDLIHALHMFICKQRRTRASVLLYFSLTHDSIAANALNSNKCDILDSTTQGKYKDMIHYILTLTKNVYFETVFNRSSLSSFSSTQFSFKNLHIQA